MATQRKPTPVDKTGLKKPENFDLEKGLANLKRIVRKNEQWVKEMAAK
jgi:hypothetical protein